MQGRMLAVAAVIAMAFLAAVPAAGAAPQDSSVVVCNEAENSHRGGYVLIEGPIDPAPPAFLRGSPMDTGATDIAQFQSPALRTCESEDAGGEDPGDDTGGEDPGDDTGGEDPGEECTNPLECPPDDGGVN